MLEDLLRKLVLVARMEVQAEVQYDAHAAMLKGEGFVANAENMQEHAGQERGHRQQVYDIIVYLGGRIDPGMEQAYTATENADMYRQDITAEKATIAIYREILADLRALGYAELENIILGILADEFHHLNDLQSIIGA